MPKFCLNRNWPFEKSSNLLDIPFGWNVFDEDTSYLFQAITKNGWAFSANHNIRTHIKLNTNTFTDSSYLVVDFDSLEKLDDVVEKSIFTPAFFYETPSSLPGNPRARGVYELPYPIGLSEYEHAQRGLFTLLEQEGHVVDTSCYNGARIFFGAKKYGYSEYCEGMLTTYDLSEILDVNPRAERYGHLVENNFLPPFLDGDVNSGFQWIVDRLGGEVPIVPRGARHNTLLFAATLLRQRGVAQNTIRDILILVKENLSSTNDRKIEDLEIDHIVRYCSQRNIDKYGAV